MNRAALMLAVTAVCASAALSRQTTSLVKVDVAVEQADGRPSRDLTRDDFEIVADGVPRPVEFFAAGDLPLSLVLMLDVSDSMESRIERDELETAIEKFFVGGLSAQDTVRIGAFAKSLTLSPPFRANLRGLLAAARTALRPRKTDSFGPSPIWDAVYTSVGALVAEEGRRAVVLVTDGRASGNRRSLEEVAVYATLAAVSINIVGQDSDLVLFQQGTSGIRVRAGASLEWLAAATSGRYIPDRGHPANVGLLLSQLVADLHARYTLGFAPAAWDGQIHPLEVRAKRHDLRVRARKTYVAGLPTQ
jgi:VWFA-related protein